MEINGQTLVSPELILFDLLLDGNWYPTQNLKCETFTPHTYTAVMHLHRSDAFTPQ